MKLLNIILVILVFYSLIISYLYFSPADNLSELNKINIEEIDRLSKKWEAEKDSNEVFKKKYAQQEAAIERQNSNPKIINEKHDKIKSGIISLYSDQSIQLLSRNISAPNSTR